VATDVLTEALPYALVFVAGMGFALLLVWIENRVD
jgi:hypothetical protein